MDGRFDGTLAAMEAELRVNLSIDGVLPLLEREAGGFMTKEEKMYVTSVNRENTPEMVTKIIDILRKKGNDEFNIFLDILDKSGNTVWANKLRECVAHQPSSSSQVSIERIVVQLNYMKLLEDLDTNSSADLFFARSLITFDTLERVNNATTRKDANEKLVNDLLQGISPRRFSRFVSLLRESADKYMRPYHRALADKLEKDLAIYATQVRTNNPVEHVGPPPSSSPPVSIEWKVVQQNYVNLLEHLDTKSSVSLFFGSSFITADTLERIVDAPTRKDASKVLVNDLLQGISPRQFSRFVSLLRESADKYVRPYHRALADKLEKDLAVYATQVRTDTPVEHVGPPPSGPDPILDGRPKEGSIFRLVSSRISADWDKFSMYLGFEDSTRLTIEMDNMRQSTKCFIAVVDWWMQGKHGTGDLPRTWRSVLQAVRDCGHRGLADDVTASLSEGNDIVSTRPPKVPDPVLGITREHEEPSAVEILDRVPSDVGLLGVTRMVPQPWLSKVAIHLGVPVHFVTLHRQEILGEMQVLIYWRDGRCGPDSPVTWKFLLDAVSEAYGSNVAERLRRNVLENRWQWCQSTDPNEPKKKLEDFLRDWMRAIKNDAVTKLCVQDLRDEGIIPESVETDIRRAKTDRDANGHLYQHLRNQATVETMYKLYDVWAHFSAEGNDKQKQLAIDMEADMEKYEIGFSRPVQATEVQPMDCKPSDVGLLGVEGKILHALSEVAVCLGVSWSQVSDFRKHGDDIAGMQVLMYWRDGWCGPDSPVTWRFLLHAVSKACGPKVVKQLERKLLENRQSWCQSTGKLILNVQQTREVVQIMALDNKPSEAQLMSISMEMGGKWMTVLLNLGIKSIIIDSIWEIYNGDIQNSCFEGLVYWRNGNASQPVTWKTLLESLRKSGLEEEAMKLKEKFNLRLDEAEVMEQEGPPQVFGDEFKKVVESNACIRLTITKCTTIGPPRIGKTCLKHLLTRKAWDVEKDMPSTPAIRAPEWVECYRGETDSLGKNWSTFSREERIKALYQSIAKEEYDANKRMESQQSGEGDGIISTDSTTDDKDVQSQSTATKSPLDCTEVEEETAVMETVVAQESLQHRKELEAVSQASCRNRKEYLLLQDSLRKFHIPEELQVAKEKEGQILHKMQILHFIDTGGQAIYHDVHPVLITSPSVYLVVFNLEHCFPVRADFLTTDLTQQALRSIHTLTSKCPKHNDFLCSRPEEPKIFLVGTHLDRIPQRDPQVPLLDDPSLDDLHKEMEKHTRDMPYCDYIQYDTRGRCFWAVDNTQAGKETSKDTAEYLDYLRELIVEESMTMDLKLPIPWIILEQLASTCKPLFEYKSICQLAMDKKLVKDEEEFQLMLHVFHVLGLFFYVPDVSSPSSENANYIFADPNVLYTLTSKLFFKLQYENPVSITRQFIHNLIEPLAKEMVVEGTLKEILEIDAEWLMELLCQLRLMASLGDFPNSQCIIPAILPDHKHTLKLGSLLLTFVTPDQQFSYLPSGLFCALIAEIIRTQPGGISWKPVMLYRRLITFDIEFGHLRIEENHATIKIDLTLQVRALLSVSQTTQRLRRALHELIRKVWRDLYHHPAAEFENLATWGVTCTYHKDDPQQMQHLAECIKNPGTDEYYAICQKSPSGLFQPLSKEEKAWFMDVDFH